MSTTTTASLPIQKSHKIAESLSKRRARVNLIAKSLCFLATGIAVVLLLAILAHF